MFVFRTNSLAQENQGSICNQIAIEAPPVDSRFLFRHNHLQYAQDQKTRSEKENQSQNY